MTRRKHQTLAHLSGRDIGRVIEIEKRLYRVTLVHHQRSMSRVGVIYRDGDTYVWTDPTFPSDTAMRRVRGREPIDGLPMDVPELRRWMREARDSGR